VRFDLGLALEILPDLLGALLVTIEAALLGIVLALAIGLVWAMLRRSARAWVAAPINWLVDFLRSTPLLIQLYFLYFGLPALGVSVGPLPTGIAALGLHYSAYVAEVYRAGIDGVPRGQWEAARALGFGRWQTWQRVVLPQAIPPVVPALGNYLISMFKDTPLLAAITVTELLQTAKIVGAERFRYLEPLTLVGALFLVVSVLAGRSVRWLEARFEVRHG
jgi:polar amino acid transport system permease protein